MKRIAKFGLMIVCITLLLITMTVGVSAKSAGISVMVNGTAVKFPDQKPVVQNERTLVPVRFVAEALGHKVSWDSDTNSVSIDGGKIVLHIGKNTAKINGKSVILDVASTVINSRTMVPLRVVAETLDCSVDWIAETKTVLFNAKKNGRELSIYERLKQTGLYYDLKDRCGNELTRFLVKKTLVKAGSDMKNTSPIKLGAGWWIEAPNIYDPSQYPDYDCGIVVTDYSKTTRDQVGKVFEILYPTGHKEISQLMLETLRGEIWNTYMEWSPATVGNKPGMAGCRYIDGREVNMRTDGNQHRMYMQVNTVGHVNPDKPKVLDEKTVKGLTRDYQLGLWGDDFADLGLK